MKLTFTVPGTPMGKERPRFSRKTGVYPAKKTSAYEMEVWVCALKAGAKQLMFWDRPVWIGLKIYLPAPNDKRRSNVPKYGFPTKKPDFDNVLKSVTDGLKHAFKDDAQIIGVLPGSGKFFGDARVEVQVTDEVP